MDAINVYAVFENESISHHKRLVCMFRTEKAAKGYAAALIEDEPGSPYQYTVELWTVSGC